jgi:hypothetical protein
MKVFRYRQHRELGRWADDAPVDHVLFDDGA